MSCSIEWQEQGGGRCGWIQNEPPVTNARDLLFSFSSSCIFWKKYEQFCRLMDWIRKCHFPLNLCHTLPYISEHKEKKRYWPLWHPPPRCNDGHTWGGGLGEDGQDAGFLCEISSFGSTCNVTKSKARTISCARESEAMVVYFFRGEGGKGWRGLCVEQGFFFFPTQNLDIVFFFKYN